LIGWQIEHEGAPTRETAIEIQECLRIVHATMTKDIGAHDYSEDVLAEGQYVHRSDASRAAAFRARGDARALLGVQSDRPTFGHVLGNNPEEAARSAPGIKNECVFAICERLSEAENQMCV